MNPFHLPLPVVSQAYNAAPTITPERIQLAPLRLETLDSKSPSSFSMQRQSSVSSATDSGFSSYYRSSTESPTMTPCGSPQLGRSTVRTRGRYHPYSPSTESQFDGVRCSSCLEYGEHVPVQPGQACVKCGTTYVEQRSTGKTVRRKRNDRQLYSKLGSDGVKPQGVRTKDQTEAGNRLDHTTLIGMHQHQLTRLVPELPTKARIGDGRKKLGWKALNPNNMSKDIAIPLTFNKEEVFISGLQVLQDSDRIIEDIQDNEHRRRQRAAKLISTNPSYSQCLEYIQRDAASKNVERIEASRRTRGTHDFRIPLGAGTKL